MKLIKFRVTNFRSVIDSGWIDTDNITALIGTNESGKTNLLVPLWKLKPAMDGEINPIADYPRKDYSNIRDMESKPVFIEAHFELQDSLVNQLVALTGVTPEDVRVANVKRTFGGDYRIGFPNTHLVRSLAKVDIEKLLSEAITDITGLSVASKAEESLKETMLSSLDKARGLLDIDQLEVEQQVIKSVKEELDNVDLESGAKRSIIVPRYEQLQDAVAEMLAAVSKASPDSNAEARKLVLKNVPSFVYYSNYGNLDSEIYLPHVIDNLQRNDLGSREEAKARTLKVLFEFVKLEPDEILELGQALDIRQRKPTEEEIRASAEKTKERDILLQSAATSLTQNFRDWWKQGEYRFRFQADGNHFRIWVSDDRRPEDIELENRSTGLQWFLSFYLIFLVESKEAHQGAILLLDEPGLSLHPLAQEDLSVFFESLSQRNQILYTTHSPFMVDPNHLDRVKAVYVNERGATAVSSNLRVTEAASAQSNSIYPVYAALGLSISETLLQGCRSVIVEGQSDQIYLSAIKNYLIGKGMITPKRELLFMPAGGVRGVSAVVSIVTGKDEELPYVILDSDRSGQDLANKLKSGSYQGSKDRILMAGEVFQMANAEIEDLFPPDFLANVVTKYLRGPEDDFDEVFLSGQPIVPQIEEYAKKNNHTLELGWKVELAKQAKARLLRGNNDPLKNNPDVVEKWKELFSKFDS